MTKDLKSLPISTQQGKQIEHFFLIFYKKLFFSAVKWNIFESFFYQLIFISHQTGLFFLCDRALYGKVGSLFALSYTCIPFLLFGIEGGLVPFFTTITSSRDTFNTFIKTNILHYFIFISSLVMFLVPLFYYFFNHTISFLFCGIIGFFMIIETAKKILKHILYLAFYNKYTARIEVLQLIFYSLSIWIYYFFKKSFSLYLFFLPFIFFSFLSCCFYWKLIKHYQATLSEDSITQETLPHFFSILKIRMIVFANQLCRTLFSGNCIIPLFAMHAGFAQAGTMTFIHYLTNTITFFLYKVSIPTTEAFLSRITYFSKIIHYQAFTFILNYFAIFTFVLGSLFFLNIKNASFSAFTIFIFFFFVHALETVFALFEKFFLLRKKIIIFTIINLATCLLCFLLIQADYSFMYLIAGCFFIRFLFFFVLLYDILLSKRTIQKDF